MVRILRRWVGCYLPNLTYDLIDLLDPGRDSCELGFWTPPAQASPDQGTSVYLTGFSGEGNYCPVKGWDSGVFPRHVRHVFARGCVCATDRVNGFARGRGRSAAADAGRFEDFLNLRSTVHICGCVRARAPAADRTLVCTAIVRRSCATWEDCLDPRRVSTARSVVRPSGVDDRGGATSPCR